MDSLYLKQIEVGPMANFIYLIGDAFTKEVLIVDPAWQIDTLFKIIRSENLELKGALISHAHFDHTNGLEELLNLADIPIYIQKEEANFVKSVGKAESLFPLLPEEHLKKVGNEEKITVGKIEITLIHTPGHTPGSQCFLIKDNLISGDTLFIRTCGRSDLPGSDPKKMYESLTQKLMKLPSETVLYPGHNYSDLSSSTLEEEKKKNPYLLCESLETFLMLSGSHIRRKI
ncbi:MAG: MBL fold metallo-hydrolase [Elusimicrobia bacterium]|nr:MBL fold metallo-hydrolase [Elusimicrobiota bacterium]